MRALWPVLGAMVILGIIFVGLAENEPETVVSPSTEYTETVIIPKTFQAASQEIKIDSKSFQSSPEINLLEQSNPSPAIIQTADGITADENSISVTRYELDGINFSFVSAFDSSGNIFGGASNKVQRIDISSNTQTTWTLPNDKSIAFGFSGSGADADSSGFFYFAMENSITKLDHNTNIFTEWEINSPIRDIAIDSSDNIYFTEIDSTSFLQKLDPNLNAVTQFFFPPELSNFSLGNNRISIDNSGIIYFFSLNFDDSQWNLIKFNPSTNAITAWSISEFLGDGQSIGVSSSGKIFFGENLQFRSKIVELDPSTNIIKRWTNPFGGVSHVAVDSSGIVFFW